MEPIQEFRGTWSPPELHELVASGRITHAEFVLLSIIDSLVSCKGLGCWANNANLAKRLNVQVRQIQNMVHHLTGNDSVRITKKGKVVRKGIKLLVRKGWKMINGERRRLLETVWSRIKIKEEEGTGGMQHVARGGCNTLHGGDATRCTHKNTTKNTKKETLSPHPAGDKVSGNGKFCLSTECNVDQSFPTTCSKKLIEALAAKRKLYPAPSINKWTKEFQILRKDFKDDEIIEHLNWYAENIGKDYVPEAHCAKTFRTKFTKIQAAKKRFDKAVNKNSHLIDGYYDPRSDY